MSDNVDPISGEVVQAPPSMDIVPLNLAALDEDALAALIPTPRQALIALQQARATNARAPKALDDFRARLRGAERNLKVALGVAVKDLRAEFPRATLSELRDFAHGANDRVIAAVDARDTAWLEFEYAKDFAVAIANDVELLRSINKNLRGEHG